MKKKNKKFEESVIMEVVNNYKLNLCLQIKNGRSVENEGLLFDPTEPYNVFWTKSSYKDATEEERFLIRINFILASLTKVEKEIIWNEYFFVEDKFWWMRKYNRSTFYRLRAKAIDKFYMLVK